MQPTLLGAAFALATLAYGQEFKLGSKVSDFNLTDVKGNPVSYSALKGKFTVVTFVATKCPISNDYNERMKAVYNDYASKGVNFIFVNANSSEPAAEVADHAQKNGFTFQVYKDPDSAVGGPLRRAGDAGVLRHRSGRRDPLSRLHRRFAQPGAHSEAGAAHGARRGDGRQAG